MDLTILETDRTEDSTVKSLYDTLVELEYGGVKPPPCSETILKKCAAGEICFSYRGEISGTCKYETLKSYTLLGSKY